MNTQPEPQQPDLLPAPSEQIITVPGDQAEAAASRVRALGGVVLWFRVKAPHHMELNIILDPTLLEDALENNDCQLDHTALDAWDSATQEP